MIRKNDFKSYKQLRQKNQDHFGGGLVLPKPPPGHVPVTKGNNNSRTIQTVVSRRALLSPE